MIPLVMANETGTAQHRTAGHFGRAECGVRESLLATRQPVQVHLDWGHGPQRVKGPYGGRCVAPTPSLESSCLGVQLKVRGKLLVRLNMTSRPIANKYREGKLKRTLKREFKST